MLGRKKELNPVEVFTQVIPVVSCDDFEQVTEIAHLCSTPRALTTKELADEISCPCYKVLRIKQQLGIQGIKQSTGRGFVYLLDREECQRITEKVAEIKKARGTRGGACVCCGEPGHTEIRCPDNPDPFECRTCKENKSRSEFYTLNRSLQNGGSTRNINRECRECSRKRLQSRYGASLENKVGHVFASIKSRSEVVTITKDFILQMYEEQEGKCFYSGLPMTCDRGSDGISVDQKIPGGGYTEENVVLCRWDINQMKRDMSIDVFLNLCRCVAQNGGLKDG